MKFGIKFSIDSETTGSQRTIAECLIREIAKFHTETILITRTPTYFEKLNIKNLKIVKIPNFKIGNVILRTIVNKIVDQLILEIILLKNSISVIYHPYNTEAIWKTFFVPQIITVHDLIPVIYPQFFKKLQYFWKYFNKPAINNSKVVIAVSENTKKDIVNYLGVDPEKIQVIYNGFNALDEHIDKQQSSYTPLEFDVYNNKYFFYLASSLYPHKNLNNLVKAFDDFRKTHSDYHLVVLGIPIDRFQKDLNTVINSAKNTVILNNVSNRELKLLFQQSIGFIYPSLYEGFGIPPLEAMALGIPVASSYAASLPEVCGDACIYFNPAEVGEITDAFLRLVESDHSDMIEKGKVQILKFSWQKAACQIIDIAEKINECYEKYN